MTCEHCQAELEDFLYGELKNARAAEVQEHLVACVACATLRAELEREQEIYARFYERTALEPPAEMWETIRARIGSEPLPQTGKEPAKGWLRDLMTAGGWAWLLRPTVLRQVAFAVVLVALSVALTTLLTEGIWRVEREIDRPLRLRNRM
jgi:anti-sigma factor RsiW